MDSPIWACTTYFRCYSFIFGKKPLLPIRSALRVHSMKILYDTNFLNRNVHQSLVLRWYILDIPSITTVMCSCAIRQYVAERMA